MRGLTFTKYIIINETFTFGWKKAVQQVCLGCINNILLCRTILAGDKRQYLVRVRIILKYNKEHIIKFTDLPIKWQQSYINYNGVDKHGVKI